MVTMVEALLSWKRSNKNHLNAKVLVILHEKELTWVGRLSYKHHTCVISALSISTTLKQHQLIWSPTVYLFSYSDLGFLYG
ncbi:hypothetical protein HanLR1_Chr03g0096071 [Helianthus annuus]|nr:hypothetical protein HanHA89_Chr03g0102691 [Helianthus annuus]KAJ0767970.1 hypothetical protein HanLR1_Chr03g0096071 [Helianthus annuus]